jgi:hypothetical protein
MLLRGHPADACAAERVSGDAVIERYLVLERLKDDDPFDVFDTQTHRIVQSISDWDGRKHRCQPPWLRAQMLVKKLNSRGYASIPR